MTTLKHTPATHGPMVAFATSLAMAVLHLQATEYWVDAEHGADGNGGTSSQDAFLTLTNAAAHAKKSGDVIWALPGHYRFGTVTVNGTTAPKLATRVSVPAGVTLKALEGPGVTFIHGAPDAGSSDAWGRGENAVRCVFLNANAKVKGFTILDGRTRGADGGGTGDPNCLGAAVYGSGETSVIEDCVISNCYAYACAAGQYVKTVRTRIFDCGAYCYAVGNNNWYDTVLMDRITDSCPNNWASIASPYRLVNSTIGETVRPGGTAGYAIAGQRDGDGFANNVIIGNAGYGVIGHPTNCVFAGSTTYVTLNDTCRTATRAELALDDDYRPAKSSVLVDRGCTRYAADGDTDVYGGQRVYNMTNDIGAVEHDWRGDYSADISRRGKYAVTNATPRVIERSEGIVRLCPGASVSGVWTEAVVPNHATVTVRVCGSGTFRVSVAGQVVATALEGTATELWFPMSSAGDIAFSYGGTDGYAEIAGVKNKRGLVLIIR